MTRLPCSDIQIKRCGAHKCNNWKGTRGIDRKVGRFLPTPLALPPYRMLSMNVTLLISFSVVTPSTVTLAYATGCGRRNSRHEHNLSEKQDDPAHEDRRMEMDEERLRDGSDDKWAELRWPESHDNDEPHQQAHADVETGNADG